MNVELSEKDARRTTASAFRIDKKASRTSEGTSGMEAEIWHHQFSEGLPLQYQQKYTPLVECRFHRRTLDEIRVDRLRYGFHSTQSKRKSIERSEPRCHAGFHLLTTSKSKCHPFKENCHVILPEDRPVKCEDGPN